MEARRVETEGLDAQHDSPPRPHTQEERAGIPQALKQDGNHKEPDGMMTSQNTTPQPRVDRGTTSRAWGKKSPHTGRRGLLNQPLNHLLKPLVNHLVKQKLAWPMQPRPCPFLRTSGLADYSSAHRIWHQNRSKEYRRMPPGLFPHALPFPVTLQDDVPFRSDIRKGRQ